jgi:hypothetical protein
VIPPNHRPVLVKASPRFTYRELLYEGAVVPTLRLPTIRFVKYLRRIVNHVGVLIAWYHSQEVCHQELCHHLVVQVKVVLPLAFRLTTCSAQYRQLTLRHELVMVPSVPSVGNNSCLLHRTYTTHLQDPFNQIAQVQGSGNSAATLLVPVLHTLTMAQSPLERDIPAANNQHRISFHIFNSMELRPHMRAAV